MNIAVLRNLARSKLQNTRFWRNAGLLMFGNVLVVLLGLLRTPLTTWIIPKAEVGMIGVVAAWLAFIHLLSLPGMDSAAYHYLAKRQYWAYAVNYAYRWRWFLLSALAFLMGALYWWWDEQYTLAWLFIVSALFYPTTSALNGLSGVLGAIENFTGLFWYRLARGITSYAGFIPLVLATLMVSKVVTFYTVNQFAVSLLQIGTALYLASRLRKAWRGRPPPTQAKEMISYGKHLTSINSISVVQGRIDALLVSLFLPLQTVADYSIALLVQEQFRQPWGVYVSVRYPVLVRLSTATRRRRFIFEGVLVTLAYALAGIGASVLAHLLVPVILPPEYISSLPYIDLMLIVTTAGLPGGIAETYFRTEQNQHAQYSMRIVGALASTAFPLFLIFRWDAYGVLVGRLLANFLFSLIGVWLFFREPNPASN